MFYHKNTRKLVGLAVWFIICMTLTANWISGIRWIYHAAKRKYIPWLQYRIETTPHAERNLFDFTKYSNDQLLYFNQKSIILTGMGRDINSTILSLLTSIEIEFGCVFNRTTIVIFESNSEDNTAEILQRWLQNKSLKENDPSCNKFVQKIVLNNSHYQRYRRLQKNNQVFGLTEQRLSYHMYDLDNTSSIPLSPRITKYANFRNFLLFQMITVCFHYTLYFQKCTQLFGCIVFFNQD